MVADRREAWRNRRLEAAEEQRGVPHKEIIDPTDVMDIVEELTALDDSPGVTGVFATMDGVRIVAVEDPKGTDGADSTYTITVRDGDQGNYDVVIHTPDRDYPFSVAAYNTVRFVGRVAAELAEKKTLTLPALALILNAKEEREWRARRGAKQL